MLLAKELSIFYIMPKIKEQNAIMAQIKLALSGDKRMNLT